MISHLIKEFKIFNMKDISSYHPKIGLSQKKTNREGRLRTQFFEKSLEFLGFLLYSLEIPHKFAPGNSVKLCFTLWKFHKAIKILRKFQDQKPKTPGNSTYFFLDRPWKFFFIFN